MLDARFVPIKEWPGKPTAKRQGERFRVQYLKLLDDLEYELRAVRAVDILVQLYLQTDQIRNDGWPRAGVNPSSPGVILTFRKGTQTVSMPCDTFSHWQQNLRAISMTLHGLRMIDQYGVTSNGEQYKGFAQLEAPSMESQRQSAAIFIASVALMPKDVVLDFPDEAYKQAARKLHPDQGGSHDEFVRLGEAYKVLKARA